MTESTPQAEPTPHVELTAAERDVLRQLADSVPPSDVAVARGVSPATVRTQISSIHRKLDVSSTTAAALWGAAHRACCLVGGNASMKNALSTRLRSHFCVRGVVDFAYGA